MSLIRSKRLAGNQAGRAGTQVQSPYSGAIHYVSIEYGMIVIRHYDGREMAREGPVQLAVTGVTAGFAEPGKVCVTLAGFTAGIGDSGMDTYVIPVKE
jgi:hypothetical protein